MQGTIARVNDARGFGFIKVDGDANGDHFFHFKDLTDLPFGPEIVGKRVKFDAVMTDTGPAARSVELDD